MDMGDLNFKIKPTDDYIFKRLFCDEENKDILISFLNAIFEEYDFLPRIKDLEFKNNEIPKIYDSNKSCRLDIKAKVNEDTYVDIEVQVKDNKNLINRGIFYNSFMMIDSIEEGSTLNKIPNVVSIWIVKEKLRNDNIFNDFKSPIVLNNIKSEKTKLGDDSVTISSNFNIIFVFLSKFKEGMLNKNLENWLKFIDNQSVNEIKDDEIIKANGKMNIFRGDRVMKEMYESQFKERIIYNTDVADAREEGIEIGREEGMKEGREEGLKEGEKKSKIEIVKNMLKLNIDIYIISQSTGLSINEIEDLKK